MMMVMLMTITMTTKTMTMTMMMMMMLIMMTMMMTLCICQGCGIHAGTNERLLAERTNMRSLTLASNRSVAVECDRFDVVFPYNYNFDACLDEAGVLCQFC